MSNTRALRGSQNSTEGSIKPSRHPTVKGDQYFPVNKIRWPTLQDLRKQGGRKEEEEGGGGGSRRMRMVG